MPWARSSPTPPRRDVSLPCVAQPSTSPSEAAIASSYDIDAAGFFADPLPTGWSGEGSEKEFGDLLGPSDLERAGRHEIAAQVAEARAQGIDAWAWLPGDLGLDALADYARRVSADVIIVPREAGHTQGLFAGLKQPKADELSAQTQRLGANVMVVDEGTEESPR